MKPIIKVFGERNSCNNYMIKLIDSNIDVARSSWDIHTNQVQGWTHDLITPGTEPLKDWTYVFMVKNPYAWLKSLHRTPHGTPDFWGPITKMSFEDFLRRPIPDPEGSMRSYINPVRMYSRKVMSYIKFNEQYPTVSTIVRSIDLQVSTQVEMDRVAQVADTRLKKPFVDFSKRINSANKETNKVFDIHYYIEQRWSLEYTPEDIEFVNSQINSLIFDKLRFNKITKDEI